MVVILEFFWRGRSRCLTLVVLKVILHQLSQLNRRLGHGLCVTRDPFTSTPTGTDTTRVPTLVVRDQKDQSTRRFFRESERVPRPLDLTDSVTGDPGYTEDPYVGKYSYFGKKALTSTLKFRKEGLRVKGPDNLTEVPRQVSKVSINN